MGNGISPPAFCDISKSHELRQFRVKGLCYMSLGFRLLTNFPNRAGPSGLVSFGKLGNWKICTCNHFPISQIVLAHLGWGLLGNWPISQIVLAHLGWCLSGNWKLCTSSHFPISRPIWAGVFWELGNRKICTCNHFPISQFPKSCWPIWAGVFWEIGKLENTCNHFPISQIVLSQMGWGLLGNWEIGKHVPQAISQFPK